MKVNLYDFDNTIYKGDSSTDFFFYCMMKYPKVITFIPTIIWNAILYKLKIKTKTKFKEKIFSFLNVIPDVDSLVATFWDSHKCYIKDFYKAKKHENDIIISASPEFLLAPITKELKVKDLIASDVDKHTGKFKGLNCYGREKIKRLNKKYKNVEVMEAYSDSISDTPMLEIADKPYIVKGNRIKDF